MQNQGMPQLEGRVLDWIKMQDPTLHCLPETLVKYDTGQPGGRVHACQALTVRQTSGAAVLIPPQTR